LRPISVGLVLSAVVGLALAVPRPASAVSSADTSAIAFAVTSGGVSELWSMAPDGTDPAALAGQPTGANSEPATSPDGTQIAFTSDHAGNADIWILDLEDGTSTQLTTDTSSDSAPAWSADGDTIAFQSDRSGNMDVWLMNPDGSSQAALTMNPASDSQPAWFPASRRIAFQSNRSGNADIWAVNADGTSLKHVTTATAPDSQPTVNPAGTLVAFTSRRLSNTDVYTAPVGGGAATRVTSSAAVDNQPAFSSDGRFLSFTSNRSGLAQVWRVPRPSGSSVQLTHATDPAGAPDWIPFTYPAPTMAGRFAGSQIQLNQPVDVAVAPGGNRIFTTGIEYDQNGQQKAGYVVANSPAGTQLWVSTFSVSGIGGGYDVAVSSDGSTVYAAGIAGDDGYVVGYNASTGAELTHRLVSGSSSIYTSVYAIALSADGSKLFLAATEYNLNQLPTKSYTLGLNAPNLALPLWQPKEHDRGDPAIGGLHLSPDGTRLFWVGDQYGAPVTQASKWNYLTIAYDTATGAEVWARTYNGTGSSEDDGYAIAVAPDGSKVFVTGASAGTATSKWDQATVAYDVATGAQSWANRFDGANHGSEVGYGIAVSPDGSAVYTGGTHSRAIGSKTTWDYLATSIVPASGARNWSTYHNGPGDFTGTAGFDAAFAVDVAPDGNTVFLSGQSFRSGSRFDFTTVGYDTGGARTFLARYDGPTRGDDFAAFEALAPDGSTLYVTGGSLGGNWDSATVGWDVSGCGPCSTRSGGLVEAASARPSVAGSFPTVDPKARFSSSLHQALRNPPA
jgi:Tol biopolymer transport system component